MVITVAGADPAAAILVCISKLNHTYFVAEQAKALALHLLGEDQTEPALLFGEKSGDHLTSRRRATPAPFDLHREGEGRGSSPVRPRNRCG